MQEFLTGAPADFEPVRFSDLPGLSAERLTEFWPPFIRSCQRQMRDQSVLRKARDLPQGFLEAAERAIRSPTPTEIEIRSYFSEHFSPFKIHPHAGSNPYAHGFVTGYYEPETLASRERTPEFDEPVRARPADLINAPITFSPTAYAAGRLDGDGQMIPYWSRAEIDAGRSNAPEILWVRDAVELFMIQVQGSARVTLPDGSVKRLVYDGRNGHPYESIGRILVSEGHIPLTAMSLHSLKEWVRRAGQAPGEAGRALLHRNPSYIFFKLVEDVNPADGPIGGEGIPLTKLRSLAIDRSIWAYGLPFWISGDLPMEDGAMHSFQRMMVAQDTGSAIVGAARGDVFYGSGDIAGQAAARVRHQVDMFILMPKA
jgi:membrane-bound lytic murein transglycosylase A